MTLVTIIRIVRFLNLSTVKPKNGVIIAANIYGIVNKTPADY
jgi:hypothetical protein